MGGGANFVVVCWGRSITVRETNRTSKLIRRRQEVLSDTVGVSEGRKITEQMDLYDGHPHPTAPSAIHQRLITPACLHHSVRQHSSMTRTSYVIYTDK